jgi:plastocyanin
MHGAMRGGSAPESLEGAATEGQAALPAPIPTEAPKGEAPPPGGAVPHDVTGTISTTPPPSAGAAVVYLEDAPIVPGVGAHAVVDNRSMSFIPFVAVVAAGGRVVFTNADPFPHNVFSPDNERFNIGLVPPKGSVAHVFSTPGAYTLLCNLHPNMLGYLVVTPSSYFAKANAKGQYALKGVPAGTYKMTAWAPRQQTVTQSVTIKDGDVTVDFTLHR